MVMIYFPNVFTSVMNLNLITEEHLRKLIASLEGRLARLQFEYGRAQELLQTQQDTILGLKEELEWQKGKTSDLETKLSQKEIEMTKIPSADNFYHEKIQYEHNIKNLIDKLDMQNRVIASLTNEQTKIKRPKDSLTTKDLSHSLDEIRRSLKDFKTFVHKEKRDMNQKLKDVHFLCARLPTQNSTDGQKIDQSKFVVLQKQVLEEFCHELEQTSIEMINEVQNL